MDVMTMFHRMFRPMATPKNEPKIDWTTEERRKRHCDAVLALRRPHSQTLHTIMLECRNGARVIFQTRTEKPSDAFLAAAGRYPGAWVKQHYGGDEFCERVREMWTKRGYRNE